MTKSFGRTLRDLRREQGIGLRMAAEELGLSASYLSRIEHGKEPPPRPEMIGRMATLLGGGESLFMLAKTTEPAIVAFLARTPSARSFLRTTIAAGWTDDEFRQLSSQVEKRLTQSSQARMLKRRDNSMQIQSNWPTIWSKFRNNLANEQKCPRHPEFPHVRSMVQGVINDVLSVDAGGIRVRSHRTNKIDPIPEKSFRNWWEHLVEHGSASLVPGGPNNPDPWRSRIVGAIMSAALPEEIEVESSNSIILKDPDIK
jgi:HTH-type transcriptional regulator, competence development regulator